MDKELLDQLEVMYLREDDKLIIGEHIDFRRLEEILALYDKVIEKRIAEGK